MTKKIIILCMLAFMFAVPCALANDAEPLYDNDEFITYSCMAHSNVIAINGEMTFAITLTNHTDMRFVGFEVTSILDYTWIGNNTKVANIAQEIVLEPYQSISVDFSYIVPEDVYWYKIGDYYYADFAPNLSYLVDTFSKDMNNVTADISLTGYTNPSEQVIPLKITNISDGTDYLNIKILDDRSILPYFATTDDGEYSAYINSYISMENKSDIDLAIINANNSTQKFSKDGKYYRLKAKDTINTKIGSSFWCKPEDVNPTKAIDYKVLFTIEDNKYLAAKATRDFTATILDYPDVTIKITPEYTMNSSKRTSLFTITNNSSKDIDNFFISYGEDSFKDMDTFSKSSTVGTLLANDTWTILVDDIDYESKTTLRFGSIVEDIASYWQDQLPIYPDSTIEVNIKNQGYQLKDRIDLYLYNHSIDITTIDLATLEAIFQVIHTQVDEPPISHPSTILSTDVQDKTTYDPKIHLLTIIIISMFIVVILLCVIDYIKSKPKKENLDD